MSFLIVSAELAGVAPMENLGNSVALHEWLNEQFGAKDVRPAHGQYRGVGEAVYIVRDVSVYDAWDVWQHAHDEFGQESVLWVDDDDVASLLFHRSGEDGGRDDYAIGEWTMLRTMGQPPRGDWVLIGNDYFQVRDFA